MQFPFFGAIVSLEPGVFALESATDRIASNNSLALLLARLRTEVVGCVVPVAAVLQVFDGYYLCRNPSSRVRGSPLSFLSLCCNLLLPGL